ncbi:polysaccharide export protein [Alteromonas aestuariivivens]|uniref:Polysaccharide export protein n=1 Tax=Alteromonas aestuariivivens TaxID=1938339 RepID=A0A3D8M5E5_9ALTE|nr:polysaccharide export protein [Alteromonas aestuariivivens]
MRISVLLPITLPLIIGLTLVGGLASAQSLEQLQQLQQARQQAGNSSPAPNITPIELQGQRTLPASNPGQAQVGQYVSQPRYGQTLPGEATFETVFPLQEPMTNPPFAANVFIGGFESERTSGLNDNYLVAPGDKISIWMWGAVSYSDVVTVDNQGNIFIPNIGPISIANTPAGTVNRTVTSRIKQIYTQDVNVYVNLLTSTPVSVYISGPVLRPGQYAGLASDSALYFLKRAGGVDFRRGSFRNIDILRAGEVIASVDLYQFVKSGTVPNVSFKDGDVILVHPIGHTLVVQNGARNAFTFEFKHEELNGEVLTEFARPTDFINHVSITGVRNNEQFARYLTLDAFRSFNLEAGDLVEYVDDHEPQVYRINIAGSNAGASQIMVNRGTRLLEVLNYVEADPKLSDIDNIFLLRESVAAKQREIIEQSLQRLERSVFTAPISSTGEGSIRVQEAQLVSDFIQRARQIEPLGKVVVSERGEIANILLEAGDTIYIPETTDLIHVGGEVMMPQSVVYNPDARAKDYVAWAGGFTQRADDERIMILRKNGNVEFDTIDDGFWAGGKGRLGIQAGDQIVVLPAIDAKSLQAIKDITQIIYQIAVAANVILD